MAAQGTAQPKAKGSNGGRRHGSRGKAVIERELMAAQALDQAKNRHGRLAKDRLEELMGIAFGAMTAHQPVSEEMAAAARAAGQAVTAKLGDWSVFGDWWDRAAYAAKELAKYQSPTFKAIAVSQVGENQPAPESKTIDVTDQAAGGDDRTKRAQATYLKLVKG